MAYKAYKAHKTIQWSHDDVKFDLVPEDTSGSVVTIRVTVPGGILVFMGEPVEIGRTLVVRGTHVESRGVSDQMASVVIIFV